MRYQFIKDLTHRNGQGSSKKFWYNMACFTATVVMLWIASKLPTEFGMDDWIFVVLFGVYLITVGGFEVILEVAKLFIQWRTGGNNAVVREAADEEK